MRRKSSCQFSSLHKINFRNFYEFFDAFYGRCFTFNNDGNYMSSRASPTYGLRVVLRVNRAEFLPWVTSTGMAVYIHNKVGRQKEISFRDKNLGTISVC
jgi:hypothetical protein